MELAARRYAQGDHRLMMAFIEGYTQAKRDEKRAADAAIEWELGR